MIYIRGVTKKYNDCPVYENFSLSIEEGKITCILGPSGCGKTTLLNMLAGISAFEGEITPKLSCSYIFQQPRLVPNLTVEANLKLVCPDRQKISDLLDKIGLSEKARAYPVELSGGQAQRISIARAFLYKSKLILMDEPFTALDTALKFRLISLFCALWEEEKRTAVFVTHDAEEAYMLSHRAVVISNGKIAADIRENSPIPRPYGKVSDYKDRVFQAMVGEISF